jgi:hypothetical protein
MSGQLHVFVGLPQERAPSTNSGYVYDCVYVCNSNIDYM